MTVKKRQYRGVSSEVRKAERRQRLVDAGIEIFGETGFHSATVKQLCRTAGLTERYFYESFKNREDLFAASYDQSLDALLDGLVAHLEQASQQPLDLAKAGLSYFFTAIHQNRHMARILLIEIYGAHYDLDRLYQRSIGRFSSLVKRIALPHLPADSSASYDVELLATGLVGVCVQMAQRWVLEGLQQPAEHLVANCMLIYGGLGDRLASKTSASQSAA